MVTIIATLSIVALAVFVLIFHGALIYAYKRGGIGGMVRMFFALCFHEFMVMFFH